MIDRSRWRKEVLDRFSRHPVRREIACEEGWRDLICDLVDRLDRTRVPYGILQVKEKWGGLRFYVEYANPRKPGRAVSRKEDPLGLRLPSRTRLPKGHEAFDRLIQDAERRSYSICERCGSPGKLRRRPSILTLCNRCHRSLRGRSISTRG